MAVSGKEKLYVSSGGSFRGLSVQEVADFAAAESGDVVSVAGVQPDGGGNVPLTAAEVGAVPLSQKGVANGVATLDGSGKIPAAQVNVSGLNYLGTWNATTNVPALTNGTGTAGDFYKTATAGSHDFGAGAIAFNVGDWVIYEGGIWQQVGSHEAVASVNAKTGIVDLIADDVGAVPAVASVSVVYANNGAGAPTPVAYTSTAATASTFVQRDTNGCVTINPPTAELHAANKGYVDPRALTQAAVTAIGALAAIATADATDPASTMALANECKAKINAVIAALQAS